MRQFRFAIFGCIVGALFGAASLASADGAKPDALCFGHVNPVTHYCETPGCVVGEQCCDCPPPPVD